MVQMVQLSSVAKFALENPSSIREIMTVVTDYRLHPEKYPRELIYLGGGWPQDNPPAVLKEAMMKVLSDEEKFTVSVRYGATRGIPEFIDAILNYEEKIMGRKISKDQIIVGLGSTDLTSALFKVLLDEGDEIIITSPGYLNYKRQVEIETNMKVKVKYWNIIKGEEFKPKIGELYDLIGNKTRVLLLTSPGNPDGQIFDQQTYKSIVDIASEKSITVILDQAYRMFTYELDPKYLHLPPSENEVHICTFSKELRIPGWRVGYLIADEELVRAVETVEQARNLTPASLQQKILATLLLDDAHLAKIRSFYKKGRKLYKDVADETYNLLRREIPIFTPIKPMGGFYIFFNHQRFMQSSKVFCEKLLKEMQIALAPGLDFGLEGWTRLSFAPLVLETSKIREGIERIKKFVEMTSL